MTTTIVPEDEQQVSVLSTQQDRLQTTQEPEETPEETPEAPVSLRPVYAAALSTTAAALVVGGIFGSWPARILGTLFAVGGAALAAWVLRSKRPALAQFAVLPIIAGVAVLSVLPSESPSSVVNLVRDAVDAGRLLRPPVPFDPGWRPLLVVVLALLGFGGAWIGAALERPLLGVILPVPLVGLAAITQPDSEQVLAGLFAFLPILGALGILFGADRDADTSLDRSFELTRLVRSAVPMVALAVALVVIGNTGFLFPKPVYDPDDRPQKPKSVPLSASKDRVLFSVVAPAGFTGPWRTGVLDIYEDDAWKLPGASTRKLVDLPASGVLDESPVAARAERPDIEVKITTRDLGPTAVLPIVPTARQVKFASSPPSLQFDTRTGGLRVPSGRAPSDVTYTLTLPQYPTAKQLEALPKITATKADLEVPAAPPAIQRLLTAAPHGPWLRLDYVRHKLLDNVTAKGGGSPADVDAKRVVDLLQGSKKGSPFEIVAAQALLARWAGMPSRIGYGFNGVNDEAGTLTVRPKNAAQWLEVRLDGYGWVPLLDVPPQAQADLDEENKPDQILPSDDIAVQVFVPIELDNPRLLFERVRDAGKQGAPIVAVVAAVWLLTPFACRLQRRRRRERWADAVGPRARIAVAYAEFRDAAADLALGDPFATPIEFLDRVIPDGEHNELAWLTARSLYGDLAAKVTELDARAAEEMSLSLRTRLRQGQPTQVRVVGFLSRSSLLRPYTEEVPNVRVPTPLASTRRVLVALPRRIWNAVRGVLGLARKPSPAVTRASLLLLVVLALITSSCSSKAETSIIGVRKVDLSLAFKDQSVVKPLPPKVIVTLIPAEFDDILRFNPGLKIPRPLAPSLFACTPAPEGTRPDEPATVAITKPPREGTYLIRNEGTLEIQGAIPLKLRYPVVSKIVVKNVKSEIQNQIYFGNVAVTTYEVETQITPTLKTVEKFSYDTDGLDLVQRTLVTDATQTVFTPNPPVPVISFGGQGATFQGAGADLDSSAAAVIQGSIPRKEAVDACGKVIDTYVASTTERFIDLGHVTTSGTDPNRPTLTRYALQLGGLVIKRESHTTQVIEQSGATATIVIDVVSTLINTEPIKGL